MSHEIIYVVVEVYEKNSKCQKIEKHPSIIQQPGSHIFEILAPANQDYCMRSPFDWLSCLFSQAIRRCLVVRFRLAPVLSYLIHHVRLSCTVATWLAKGMFGIRANC